MSCERLEGKVALVVGASGKIGSAIARAFLREGARVAVASHLHSAKEVAAGIAAEGGACRGFEVNIADYPSVQRLFKQIRAELGPVEILANAAGAYGPIGPVEANDPSHWTSALLANVAGAFYLVRAAVPQMEEKGGGRIILFSGGGGAYGRPYFSSYSACKAAVVRLTESIALELSERKILVNAIAPGPVKSALWEQLRAAGPYAGEAAVAELRRMDESGGVSPERAARLAVMLATTTAPLTGRLISAVWDDWENLDLHVARIAASDAWTLRRMPLEAQSCESA